MLGKHYGQTNGSSLCIHLFGERGFVYVSQLRRLLFFCVALHVCVCEWKLFGCICMPMRLVDQKSSRPVCSSPDLCEALSEVWSDRGRKVSSYVKSGLLAWMDARTYQPFKAATVRWHTLCIPTLILCREGVAGWGEQAPMSLPSFHCLEPFYLMNAPQKMTVPV